jgi:hypothetical protein
MVGKENIPEKYGYINDDRIFDCTTDLSTDVGLEVIVLGILRLVSFISNSL